MEDKGSIRPKDGNSSAKSDGYIFGRADYQASARLNLQHLYYKLHTDYLLHPDIPLAGDELRIAEIGTGTGIWLLDLAQTLPSSAKLDGFDISANQFPRKELLPKNTTMQELDVFAPLPDHLVGRYDVVHLRLFCTIVRGDDASPLVSNLVRMLKPGGYLQWVENDTIAQEVRAFNPKASKVASEEFLAYMQATQDRLSKTSWVTRLDSTFQHHGLIDTKLDRFTTRPEFGRLHDDTLFWTVEDFSLNFLDKRPETMDTGKGAEVRRLVAKAYDESINGVSVMSDFVVVVGRKPAEKKL